MSRRLILGILVAFLAGNGASADDSKKKDSKNDPTKEMKKLEGNWRLTRQEDKGNLRPGGGDSGIFIEDGKIFWTQGGKEAGGQKGDVTIDASTNPKSIDVEITRGSNIGRKWLGIYKFERGKLIVCWGEVGSEKRPKKFITKIAVGAGQILETYQPLDGHVVADDTESRDAKKSAEKVDASAPTKQLEGNWLLTRQEVQGNLRPGGGKSGIFIEDGKIFWTQDGKEAGGQTGEISFDPSANPMSLEVEITRGSNIGRKWLAIYQIKGDKLTICWGEVGSEKRPKKFVTKTALGAGQILETYKKQKE